MPSDPQHASQAPKNSLENFQGTPQGPRRMIRPCDDQSSFTNQSSFTRYAIVLCAGEAPIRKQMGVLLDRLVDHLLSLLGQVRHRSTRAIWWDAIGWSRAQRVRGGGCECHEVCKFSKVGRHFDGKCIYAMHAELPYVHDAAAYVVD